MIYYRIERKRLGRKSSRENSKRMIYYRIERGPGPSTTASLRQRR